MRFQTAPTGPGENIELPKYFLKLHQTEPAGPGSEAVIFAKIDTYGAVANRTYRAWGLPIYFLKLHETAPTGPENCGLAYFRMSIFRVAVKSPAVNV